MRDASESESIYTRARLDGDKIKQPIPLLIKNYFLTCMYVDTTFKINNIKQYVLLPLRSIINCQLGVGDSNVKRMRAAHTRIYWLDSP